MSNFAPAYHHESNEVGLNQLLSDIVGRPRTVHQLTTSSEDDENHLVDDEAGLESPELRSRRLRIPSRRSSFWSTDTGLGRLSPWSSRSHSHARAPSRSQSHRSNSSSHAGSQNGARSIITAVSASLSHKSCRSNSSAFIAAGHTPTIASRLSQTSEVKSLEAFDERSDLQGSDVLYGAPSSPKRVADRRDGRFATKHRLTARSPIRRSTQFSPPLSRIDSGSTLRSEKFDFPPHPGVRPHFEESREILGEASGPSDDDNYEYPKPLSLALILLGICLSVFIVSVNRNIVATAVPKITARFHSYQDIGWYGSAYLLTASAFQPLYGRIYMRFDTKSVYLLSLVVFEAGSLLCALSPTSNTLIVGRAVQGLGSAGILTGSFVVGTHSVRLEKRPIVFAGVGMLFGVGALSGPILGGVLTDLATWRWCFYINLPVGAVTFVTVMLCFKPQRHDTGPRTSFLTRLWELDWIGNILILGACTMLFLALEYSEEGYSWSSARCVGLIVGFSVTLVIFIGWMFWKGKEALIPVHIARQRTVAASCGAAFFIYGALLLQAYYLPIWFQAIKGDSAIRSGVSMIPYMVTNAFFSLFAGVFVSKNGLFAPPAIIGCAIGTVGCGLLAALEPNTSTAKWVGYEVLVSAGLGMAIQQGFSAVQTALPLHEVPIGTAAVVACQSIGGAIFVSVGNTLLQNQLLDANTAKSIPGVNIRAVIELGATRFREVVSPQDLPALIKLYNDALQTVLIAAVPLAGCAFLCSLCMEWRSVRTRKQVAAEVKA